MIAALATTAGCSVLFGFDELLPGPPAPVVEAGTPDADAAVDGGPDAACLQGFDDCDDEPGCETLITGNDPTNCGACGRSCGGAACTSGACSPEVIATEDALTIAADTSGVYWSTISVDAGADAEPEGAIVRVAPDGGSRSVVAVATSPTNTGAIALDATHVYWGTTTDKVRRAPKGGGLVESFDLPSVAGQLTRLTVSSDTVFVSIRAGTTSGRIDAIPLSGAPSSTIAENQEQPYGIAVDTQHVYWVSMGAGGAGSGRITQALLDGGSLVSIPSNGVQPQYLATDGKELYWTHVTVGDGLWAGTLPLTSGSRVVKLFGGPAGRGVAADADHVYWSTETGIDRVRKDGTKHTQLVKLSSGSTREIAIDEAFVYFVIQTPPIRIARTPK